MSGDRYFIQDQRATYFLTFTIIDWIDLFSRREYRDIAINSLDYCMREKGLVIHAFVIMTNHIHIVAYCKAPYSLSSFIRDFKKYTNKEIIKEMNLINESRQKWLFDKFSFEAKRTGRALNYKIWQDGNHAILIDHSIDIWQKINYIHENPVRAGWVEQIDEYVYSSAKAYNNKPGILPITVIK